VLQFAIAIQWGVWRGGLGRCSTLVETLYPDSPLLLRWFRMWQCCLGYACVRWITPLAVIRGCDSSGLWGHPFFLVTQEKPFMGPPVLGMARPGVCGSPCIADGCSDGVRTQKGLPTKTPAAAGARVCLGCLWNLALTLHRHLRAVDGVIRPSSVLSPLCAVGSFLDLFVARRGPHPPDHTLTAFTEGGVVTSVPHRR